MDPKKVYCYITRENEDVKEVLVYQMPENRKAGVQVPGADLAEGQDAKELAMAVAKVVSGLDDLAFVGDLGNTYYYDLDDDVSYQRFFFHFESNHEEDAWQTDVDGVVHEVFWMPVAGASKKIYWNQAKLLNRV